MTKRLNSMAPPPYPLPTFKEVLQYNDDFADDNTCLKGNRALGLSLLRTSMGANDGKGP